MLGVVYNPAMHRARLFASLVAVVTAVAAVPQADAQRGNRTDREHTAKARERYDAGKKAYNLGEFEKAIELWKSGYEYKDDPIFLFNIAQAYRQKGDLQRALFFFRAYLREDPRARNRDDVEQRIAELQELAGAQPTDPAPTRPAPAEPPPAVPEPPPIAAPPAAEPPPLPDEGPERPGRAMKIGGIAMGGAGLAVTALGAVFLVRAASIEGEIEEAAASGMPWSAELVDRESSGRTAQTLGLIAVGVGAAAALGGVMMVYSGARRDANAAREYRAWLRLAPGLGAGSASLSLSLPF
jgi:tetratricopeptide (TPR) repeat protein